MTESKSIIQLDQAFAPTLYAQIKQFIYSDEFSWVWTDSTSFGVQQNNMFQHSLARILYIDGDYYHQVAIKIESAFIATADKLNLQINEIKRIRLGLIPQTISRVTHSAHVDFIQKYKTAIVYFTTCDAPTILYKQFYDNNFIGYQSNSVNYLKEILKNELEVEREISAVENTGVIFDGHRYHSSTTPTNVSRRIAMVINFN